MATTFTTFAKAVISELESRLADYEISEMSVTKLNDEVLHGVTIRHTDSDTAPTMYLDASYEDYCNGYSLDDIVTSMVSTVLASDAIAPLKNASDFDMSFENIRDKLTARVIDSENNTLFLQSHPFGYIGAGLAIIAEINISDEYRCIITNQMAEQFNLNMSEVFETAIENTQSRYPATLMNMETALFGDRENLLDGEGHLETMGVLSNEADCFGAVVIAYRGVMDKVHELVGSVYLLPSSLHEWIVLRDGDYDPSELKNMVLSANQTVVSKAEQLSSCVFKLDAYGLHRVA